ncbi:hypothetical protein RJZ56_005107 [Blastomyces dermatitidis]|uniref:UPF0016 domain-containing protein n=3 Tax=Blastomyces TaxID=229219 RepID=A0A179U8Y5_BLAGS|nr:UPF0016 domain-containing protein [Blastomyces gilchristii SLH14081]XP_045277704.1 uncharacterized protein BDCG_06226 [Blastomyces dermatitidis ER-3]EGE82745.1 hypothetical protein BDDG_05689 [Blastomyces dermatitidis ATCC 18188]EQL29218.1 hypothetical protein BDFG_08127 [Blastomyces dermatitidis ATCC 26199]EEQ91106.1 hypothetical protein BDCG_06226 [Blastomyces dermatitidis ER-3]OAT04193.1 UPF0016 domain-containing protein [Blastomyces gilchristii SLH14081]
MRIRRFPSPFLLLAIPAITSTLANPLIDSSGLANSRSLISNRAAIPDSAPLANYQDNLSPKARDVPYDGKDGKPHAGPWVETNAGRDRKKAKESPNGEQPVNPDSTDPPSQHYGPDGRPIPASNDGVMDDPNREPPKEGTTGTEGGVSEKNKESNSGTVKNPDPPKEVPPLPHSEQQKISPGDEAEPKTEGDGSEKDTVLEKPEDLPELPHSIPRPASPGRPSDPLDLDQQGSPTDPSHYKYSQVPENMIQPLHSFLLSLTMILFSEVGDKTFLVAALMAMRHPRMVVFSSAFTALIAMTVLSALLGHAVPTLISKSFTNILAAVLFLIFGVKMAFEAKKMAPDEGVGEEMKEVEMELEEKEHQHRRLNRRGSISPYALEAGRGPRKSRSSNHRLPPPESISSSSSRGSSPSRGNSLSSMGVGLNNLFSFLLSPAWVQTFVMTFLGEWGDRSQIATIAMAAGKDYWWVTCGAVTGHGICTAAAVIGGRAIAGRVSMRAVTFGGAAAFFIFGIIYIFEAIY